MSSRSETYSIRMKLEFSHAYLPSGECGVTVEPDSTTANTIRKSRAFFKQQNACSWLLLAADDFSLEPGEQLVFRLKPKSPDFFYYTSDLFTENEGCTIEDGETGSWKILRVLIDETKLETPETISVAMSSPSRYFEFLVFPSEKGIQNALEVREENDGVKFSRPKEMAFPGTETYLWRFVTAEPLPLTRKSPYKFHLWEKRKSGDNQLARLTDVPPLKSFSPFSPKDTITSFFYL